MVMKSVQADAEGFVNVIVLSCYGRAAQACAIDDRIAPEWSSTQKLLFDGPFTSWQDKR